MDECCEKAFWAGRALQYRYSRNALKSVMHEHLADPTLVVRRKFLDGRPIDEEDELHAQEKALQVVLMLEQYQDLLRNIPETLKDLPMEIDLSEYGNP